MNAQIWIRILGLLVAVTMFPETIDTVSQLKHPGKRRRIKVIMYLLPVLNIVSALVEGFSQFFCPILIDSLTVCYYTIKAGTSFLYCDRVDSLLHGFGKPKHQMHLLDAIRAFHVASYILCVGKSILLYKSFLVDDEICAVEFGGGSWTYLDEILFTIGDLSTVGMLLYMQRTFSRTHMADVASDPVKRSFRRLLRITFVPMISTIAAIWQIAVDPSSAPYVGTCDMQVHMLCLFAAYATSRAKRSHTPGRSAIYSATRMQGGRASGTFGSDPHKS